MLFTTKGSKELSLIALMGGICTFSVLAVPLLGGPSSSNCSLAAVGYYIAVNARAQYPDMIYILGNSNLPSGSIVTIYVSDSVREGSGVLNEEVTATVGSDGIFTAEVRPSNKKNSFRMGQICNVEFSARYPKQPESVLRIVGKNGENLGDPTKNPQIQAYSDSQALIDIVVVGS
jgi:hypothetical protein